MSAIPPFLVRPWLYLVIIILGTGLKFYNLNTKLFWEDEVSTVLYTSGLKGEEIKSSIPLNKITDRAFYDGFLHPNTRGYSFNKQVAGIMSDTHLTPAHYVFLTVWHRIVGDDNLHYRLFSVFAFLLSLPFLFLLAKSLFDSSLAGWIASSLYATSPFIHYEAQEARYYSLWVCFFIMANYFFLKAVKHNKTLWWIIYSVTSILALYISALSGFILIGHLLYVLLYKREQRITYVVSLIFILLTYLPWIYFLYTVRETIQSGLAWHKMEFFTFRSLGLLYFQLIGFTKSFTYLVDNGAYLDPLRGIISPSHYLPFLLDLTVLAIILYGILFLCMKTSKEKRGFLLLMLVPLFLFFYISDVIRGAFSSGLWRYQMVNMAVIILVVTNLFHAKIANGKPIFLGIYIGLVAVGILSILKIGANRCWNTRPDCPSNIEEAQIISQASNPLVITEFGRWGFANFLAVLNESQAKNVEIVYAKGKVPNIKEMVAGKSYSNIYVIQASDSLARGLKAEFGEKMLPQRKEPNRMSPQIWHIKP